MKFTNQDVQNYYDQTAIHYEYFWNLDKSMALHYGIWRKGIKSFSEALAQTNIELATRANIKATDRVLDAGCGVGGSSVYLAKNIGCEVVGVTLSQQQVERAYANAEKNKVKGLVNFYQRDYCNTGFEAESFDVIWGIECHLTESSKEKFVKEASRLLKPGGRLIIAEYFLAREKMSQGQLKHLRIWLNNESISDMVTLHQYKKWLDRNSFDSVEAEDITKEITPSARRMFFAAMLGGIGTKLYNWFVKKATYFSRVHYKAQLAQYRSLRRGAWTYKIVLAKKRV